MNKKNKIAIKFDEGKPKYTYMPWLALHEVAKVFTKGGIKYGKFNYSKEKDPLRYLDASMRHIQQYLTFADKNDIDEIGTHHLANATASVLMALDVILNDSILESRNSEYFKKKKNNEISKSEKNRFRKEKNKPR